MYARSYHMSVFCFSYLACISYLLVEPKIQIYIRMYKNCNYLTRHKTKKHSILYLVRLT